jgi:hypothetical protein
MSASLPLRRIDRRSVALIGLGLQCDVAVRRLVLIARRQDKNFATLAVVRAGRPDVFQRRLPDVHYVAGDRALVGGRNLKYHWTDILSIEEGHEVDRVGIRRERLVFPIQEARPVDDLVPRAFGLADHGLVHEIGVDGWHPPDDGLDCTPLNGAEDKVVAGKMLRVRRSRRAN